MNFITEFLFDYSSFVVNILPANINKKCCEQQLFMACKVTRGREREREIQEKKNNLIIFNFSIRPSFRGILRMEGWVGGQSFNLSSFLRQQQQGRGSRIYQVWWAGQCGTMGGNMSFLLSLELWLSALCGTYWVSGWAHRTRSALRDPPKADRRA